MAYNRLDQKYKAGQVWDEAAISHIDNSFDKVYNDFYDDKSTGGELVEYFNTFDATSVREFSATFAGWTGYIGTIKNISQVKFKFRAVSGYPVSIVCIKFWELPDKSTLTPNADGRGYTPDINSWNVINATAKSFKAVTDSNVYTEQTIELDTPIVNNTKQLVMGIDFNNVVTCPITFVNISTFGDDAPPFGVVTSSTRNPDYENLTEVSIKNTRWTQTSSFLSVTDYNFDNPNKVVCPVCTLYNFEGGSVTSELGTQNKDKFSTLVKDVLTNAGIQDNVDLAASMVKSNFKSGIEKTYYKGSQNLDRNQNIKHNAINDQTSGFFWGIGKVASDVMIAGFKTGVKCRIKSDRDEVKATKVWGYLYESDVRPDASSQGANRILHVGTNTTLLRKVEVDVNLDVASEESAIVEFIFETPYYNTKEKYLYIGYNMDVPGYTMACNTYTQAYNVIASIDGGTYGTCYNYRTISKTQLANTEDWLDGYVIGSAQPYHLLKGAEKWYPAEGLQELIKEASSNLVMAPTAKVCLADQYDLVVGDTFQMFYRGVIKCFDINSQGINVLCRIGNAYPRYFECTPTEPGEYDLVIQCRDIEGTFISTGKTKLVVHEVPTYATAKTINVMAFGDSLTSGGGWVGEGVRRLVGTDNSASGPASLKVPNLTINTYGAVSNTVNTHPVRYEGYGGWGWTSFMSTEQTKSTVNGIFVTLSSAHGYDLNTVQKSVWVDNNGKKWELEDFPANNKIKFNRGDKNNATQAETLLPTSLTCSSLSLTLTGFTATWESGNPFYDTTNGKVDFAYHASKHGSDPADVAACLLSWNLGGGTSDGYFDFVERIEGIIEDQAKPLIRQLHNDMPNTKLIVMGLQLNSLTGGMAANYGASGGYSDAWGAMMFAFDYDKALENMCNEDEFKSYCYYVDTKGQFDTEYMMPWEEHPVNTRLSSVTEMRGINGVHPTGAGYYQIGDAFFRKLVAVLNDINE